MAPPLPNDHRSPIGHMWLRQRFAVRVPRPYVESYVVAGARRTEINGPHTVEYYGKSYLPRPEEVRAHLKFALRHEPVDLRTLIGALRAMGPAPVREWVLAEPTGAFSRRAWFLYERFIGELDLEDARAGNYVEALDGRRHVTADPVMAARYRVSDNLLGDRDFCPTVRRTSRLIEQMGIQLGREARALVASYDPATLQRAISYLYTKETRSSFAIEGETPSPNRTSRFIAALRTADRFDPVSEAAIIALQNQIVDPRYAAAGWRDFQNFVGEAIDLHEQVHFICPKPGDVSALMRGWSAMTARLPKATDPVVAAAVAAFGFVFIHPFEDGNGRIHRYVMHHVLARSGFSPEGVIFPISAAIERDRRAYDAILESFSDPLFKHIDWQWLPGERDHERTILVENATADLYRYFDATLFAEYLHDRVAETVHTDLKKELTYVAVFDRASEGVREIVDMPNRRASLLIRLCLQNTGRLSNTKRDLFPELTEGELHAIENVIGSAIAHEPANAASADLFDGR